MTAIEAEADVLVGEVALHSALCDSGRSRPYCSHCLRLLVERLLRAAATVEH